MSHNMTPSAKSVKEMTTNQINKAVSNYRALLEKHAHEFKSGSVQTVLGQSEFAEEQFAVFQRRVEMNSNFIVRTVKVNRTCSPQEALDATGRWQYADNKVVDAMPKAEADEVEVVFFQPDITQRNGCISDDDLGEEYDRRGLKPADPISIAAFNEADPVFADEQPHGTHWKDANGNWCYATFHRFGGNRGVRVSRDGSVWRGDGWFAGVRK